MRSRILTLFLVFLMATPISPIRGSIYQDQVQLGVGTAITNFLSLPFTGIKNFFSRRKYEKIRQRDQEEAKIGGELLRCNGAKVSSFNQRKDIRNLQRFIREEVCTCSVWGTCNSSLCDCEILCPDNFEIFNRRNIEDNTHFENSFVFRNSTIKTDIEQTKGYCWGHASMTSKFNRLGFFKPNQKPPYNINSSNRREQKKAIKYYKKIIDKILNNEATDIPGFENLSDFSRVPSLQTYIGDKMAKSWAKNAMSLQGLTVAANGIGQTRGMNRRFFAEVKDKLDNHQQPQIVFTRKGEPFKTHTVLVSNYTVKKDGSLRLCIRDNDKSASGNANCAYYMEMNDDGSVVYNSWGDLGGIAVAHNEEADTVRQYDSLLEKCQDEKGCD